MMTETLTVDVALSVVNAHTAFSGAVVTCSQTFEKNKRKLRDLSPRFWVALLDLELGCNSNDWEELCQTFKAAYRYLGAPGDFGYGTPCGDGLRKVYDTWNLLCKAQKAAAEARPAETFDPIAMGM
jgi:hypothetical protein